MSRCVSSTFARAPWAAYVVWYLEHIVGEEQAPWQERLSHLVGLPQFADAEYQDVIAALALDS